MIPSTYSDLLDLEIESYRKLCTNKKGKLNKKLFKKLSLEAANKLLRTINIQKAAFNTHLILLIPVFILILIILSQTKTT